jgi:hypothetical protein
MHIVQVNDPGFLCKLHEQLAKLRSKLQLTEDWTEDSPDYQARPAAEASSQCMFVVVSRAGFLYMASSCPFSAIMPSGALCPCRAQLLVCEPKCCDTPS